jgi:hypothetical protein
MSKNFSKHRYETSRNESAHSFAKHFGTFANNRANILRRWRGGAARKKSDSPDSIF